MPIAQNRAMTDLCRILRRRLPGALSALLLGACAGPLPQPWEKGLLARPEMAMDVSGLEARFGDHIYGSRESASGGGVAGGASCGCN